MNVNVYENIVILEETLSEEAVGVSTQKVKDLITSGGGEVLKTDLWGRRKLGYAINKKSRGFYILFLFRSPSGLVKKLEDYYKVNDEVIKYMVIKLEKKQKEAALAALIAAAPAPAPVTEPAPVEAPVEEKKDVQ